MSLTPEGFVTTMLASHSLVPHGLSIRVDLYVWVGKATHTFHCPEILTLDFVSLFMCLAFAGTTYVHEGSIFLHEHHHMFYLKSQLQPVGTPLQSRADLLPQGKPHPQCPREPRRPSFAA